MKRIIISAAAAIILAAGSGLAPARAAPLPSGVAQSVIDDQGAVEQARWVRCWRPDGWRGHGWGWRHGHGWGHRRHGGWGHRHGGWRHHGHGGRGHFHHGGGHGHGHGHGGHHR
jgi:hypothetical protein